MALEENKERLCTEQAFITPREEYVSSPQPRIPQAEAAVNCECPKILLVDDNESILFVLQNYLKTAGLTADEALNGQEAINKLIERSMMDCCGNYKLVIMDVDMPLLNGIEATKLFKLKVRNGELPETPVVALSAGQLRADQEDLFLKEIGFAGYISKPIGRLEFLKILKGYDIL